MSVGNYYFLYQYIVISSFVGMLVQMEVKRCYRIYSLYLIFKVMRFEFFDEGSIVFCIMLLLKCLLPRRWMQLVPLEL
jgi:hypothetical protein